MQIGFLHFLLDFSPRGMYRHELPVTNRIRQLRHATGISIESLAEELEIDPSTLARWERGETKRLPWDYRLEKLAERLGVTVPYLLGFDDNGSNKEIA